MADVTNPRATRDQGAANAVRQGMELLTWRYPPEEWQRHLDARARRRWLAGFSKRPEPRRPFPTVAVATGAVSAATFMVGVIAESVVVLGAGGVALVGTVIGHFATRKRLQPVDLRRAPEVLFTSTGVLFGRHARRWRGYRYRLEEARVRFGELTHLEPAYLELEFSSGWRETTLSIPVPSALERDVVELAARLEDMMLGRELGGGFRHGTVGSDDIERHS